jgi:TorA maturation chaperone TorD
MISMANHSKADEPKALWRYFLNYHLKVWVPLFLEQTRQADDVHPAVDLALSGLELWLNEQEKREEGYDQ